MFDRANSVRELIHTNRLLTGAGRNLHGSQRRFFNGACEIADRIARAIDQQLSLIDALAAFFRDHHGGICRALDFAQNLPHLNGRVAVLIGEVTNLHRDDSETFAFFTRACRFNRRVEC